MKTPDQRALPPEDPQHPRAAAWDVVLENDGLVKFLLNRFTRKITTGRRHYYGRTLQELFEELLPTAYEGALVAAESFDPSKGYTFATYAGKVIWRDLTDELIRWRAASGVGDEELSLDDLLEGSEDHDFEDDPILRDAIAVDPIAAVEERLDAERDIARVREALNEREFQVLQLTADGYPPREIGERLGITGNNARVILHRAREKAREALS